MKHKKINRRIRRQRDDYYNKSSLEILASTKCIAIEGLRVSEMFETQEKEGNDGKKKGKKEKKADKGA